MVEEKTMEVQSNHNRYPKETDSLIRRHRSNGPIMSLDDHEVSDRLGFIRKVYGILSAQLFVTFGAIYMTKTNSGIDGWMRG